MIRVGTYGLVLAMAASAAVAQVTRIPPPGYADPTAGSVFAPPPRPPGHDALSDGDLYATLQGQVLRDAVDSMPEPEYWWWRYHARFANLEREAGQVTWIDRNPPRGQAPRTVVRENAQPAAPARPGRCMPTGECYYAVVAHHGDERDAYQASYEGTRLGWGIQVSDRSSAGFSVPFTVCGIQVYAPAAQAANIRGRLSPTSESAARRYSLSPHGGGFAICSWSPPRYTGPNR